MSFDVFWLGLSGDSSQSKVMPEALSNLIDAHSDLIEKGARSSANSWQVIHEIG